MQNNNKTSQLHLRLTVEEHEKLRSLAKDYPSLSAFILDACWCFNGPRHLKRIEYIEKKYELLMQFRSDLNHLAGNLNQLVQYTNHCIKTGIYLSNTSDEVIRITNELNNCLLEYKRNIRKLELELRTIVRKI